jgi:gluconolactonase
MAKWPPIVATALASGLAPALALMLAGPAHAQGQPQGEKPAAITAIAGVVPGDAKWEMVWSGPMTADGMIGADDGTLLFAQEQSNSIMKLWPDGRHWVLYPYVHGAGAVSADAQSRLFAVERTCTDGGLGLGPNCTVMTRVVQLAPERKVLADKFADGSTLGRLNDLAADGHGGAYYTQGGLFHVTAAGMVNTIAPGGNPAEGGLFTNGLVLSPDGKTLYVTNRTTVLAFDVGPDGKPSNQRNFASLANEPQGSFGGDGLAVDAEGRLYVTGDAGIYVFDKAGTQLGVIPVPRRAITLAFAGPDRKALYVGAMGAVTPDGQEWATPQGVRNVAMTIYRLNSLATGFRK